MAGTVAPPYGREIMWDRIAELVDRAPSLDVLRAHRLQFLAASLWREQRQHRFPRSLLTRSGLAATTTVAAPVLLSRAKAAYHGRLMLMKGLEVAVRYPDPGLSVLHRSRSSGRGARRGAATP